MSETHFRDVLAFLKTHQWIYNYPNTDILVRDVFSNFPSDWSFTFDAINDVMQMKGDCPDSLRRLLEEVNGLKFGFEERYLTCDYKLRHNSGLSRKKTHEVLSLAPHIDEICRANDLGFVVDVGAGVGYLSHLLNAHYGYPVLALERSPTYVSRAYDYQRRFHPESKSKVIFLEHFVDENSSAEISRHLEKYQMGQGNGCLVGLHACADLSVAVLRLFLDMERIKAMVIMPCCYHRMKRRSDQGAELFENFPCSDTLKGLFAEYGGRDFLGGPFMRLACQQTFGSFLRMSPEEHEVHAKSQMYRAILQQAASEAGYTVRRLKRKTAPPDSAFETYLSSLGSTHSVAQGDTPIGPDQWERFGAELREIWRARGRDLPLGEALQGLQAALQAVCEGLVLLDRAQALRERGVRCAVRRVADELLSPRCCALIAVKDA